MLWWILIVEDMMEGIFKNTFLLLSLCLVPGFSHLFKCSSDLFYPRLPHRSQEIPFGNIHNLIYDRFWSLLFHLVVICIDQEGIWILIHWMASNSDLWVKDSVQWAKHRRDYILRATIDFVSYFTAQWLDHDFTDVNIRTIFLSKQKTKNKLRCVVCIYMCVLLIFKKEQIFFSYFFKELVFLWQQQRFFSRMCKTNENVFAAHASLFLKFEPYNLYWTQTT